ncbi:MAG TPA: hypothetical protein VGC74_15890 [Stenotrophomonas sp.]|jgi:hypothetical protein
MKMGAKSEAFCRQAVVAFAQNPDVMTRNFDVTQFQAQLATLDSLRPILVRTTRLYEKMRSAEVQIGSSIMRASLEGYAVLKVAGARRGLEAIRTSLSERFTRRRGPVETQEPAPNAPTKPTDPSVLPEVIPNDPPGGTGGDQ